VVTGASRGIGAALAQALAGAGARVVLASRETALDGGVLAELIESAVATMMQATPATWRLLLEAEWAGS
jgi:NAD(P)-dependent dehydrogenase (short-subunit alcohol dehydrogenase family)